MKVNSFILLLTLVLLAGCDEDNSVALLGGGSGGGPSTPDVANGQIPAGYVGGQGQVLSTSSSEFGAVDDPSGRAAGVIGNGDPGLTSGDWHTGAWGADVGS